MTKSFTPPVAIPEELLVWLRANGSRNAFVAAMWNRYQETGGISETQLALLQKEKPQC